MMVWKMIFLFNWVVFRFHVNLPGCRISTILMEFSRFCWELIFYGYLSFTGGYFPPLFYQMLHLIRDGRWVTWYEKKPHLSEAFIEVGFSKIFGEAHDPNTRKLAKGFYVVVKIWQFFFVVHKKRSLNRTWLIFIHVVDWLNFHKLIVKMIQIVCWMPASKWPKLITQNESVTFSPSLKKIPWNHLVECFLGLNIIWPQNLVIPENLTEFKRSSSSWGSQIFGFWVMDFVGNFMGCSCKFLCPMILCSYLDLPGV